MVWLAWDGDGCMGWMAAAAREVLCESGSFSGPRRRPPAPCCGVCLTPTAPAPPPPPHLLANREGVQEAAREEEGYFIRSGIVVVLRNQTIKAGTVI